MIVEPLAGDRVEDNLNPVGRAYYGVLHPAVHARLALPGRRPRARRAGRRGEDRGRCRRGRLHALPPGRRDAVQPRVRGAAVTFAAAGVASPGFPGPGTPGVTRRRASRRARATPTPRATWTGMASGCSTRCTGRRADHPAVSALVDRALPGWKAQIPLPRPARPGDHVRPARERAVGTARRRAPTTGRRPPAMPWRCWITSARSRRSWCPGAARASDLLLAAEHPERVSASGADRARPAADSGARPRRNPRDLRRGAVEPRRAGRSGTGITGCGDWPGFLDFFFSEAFTEPHSTKQIEDAVGWGLETSPRSSSAAWTRPG